MAEPEHIVYINKVRNDMADFMGRAISKVSSKGGSNAVTASDTTPIVTSRTMEQQSIPLPPAMEHKTSTVQAQDTPIPFFCYSNGVICTVDIICKTFPIPLD